MARGKVTLFDVPADQRARGAAEARKSILQLLTNPHLSEEQKADLMARLKWASQWEALDVGEVLPPPEAESPPVVDEAVVEDPTPEEVPPTERVGTNHSVELVDELNVSEDH